MDICFGIRHCNAPNVQQRTQHLPQRYLWPFQHTLSPIETFLCFLRNIVSIYRYYYLLFPPLSSRMSIRHAERLDPLSPLARLGRSIIMLALWLACPRVHASIRACVAFAWAEICFLSWYITGLLCFILRNPFSPLLFLFWTWICNQLRKKCKLIETCFCFFLLD